MHKGAGAVSPQPGMTHWRCLEASAGYDRHGETAYVSNTSHKRCVCESLTTMRVPRISSVPSLSLEDLPACSAVELPRLFEVQAEIKISTGKFLEPVTKSTLEARSPLSRLAIEIVLEHVRQRMS